MKVLITLKSIDQCQKQGGVASYFKNIRKYLEPDIEYFHFSDVPGRYLFYKAISRVRDTLKFIRICRDDKKAPDIVHLNPSLGWSGLLRDAILLKVAVRSGRKTIVFFRGWNKDIENKISSNRLVYNLFYHGFKSADAFVVLSSKFGNKLREWHLNQPIYIETTTVDPSLPEKVSSIRKTKDFKGNHLLFLARIEKEKGIFESLHCHAILKQKFTKLEMTVAGDGDALDEVKNYVNSNGISAVHFCGYVTGEEKAKVFAKSQIYLFPTTHGEGMPNAVLEAMAAGLPVVTRAVGGLTDFFQDGKMGFITQSSDPVEFARLVEILLLNPKLREQISQYNSEYARSYFLVDNVVKRLNGIYKDVFSKNARDSSWMDYYNGDPQISEKTENKIRNQQV